MYYSSPCKIMRLEAYPSKQNYGKIDFCRFQRTKRREPVGSPEPKTRLALLFSQSPEIFDPSRLQRLSGGLYFTYQYQKNTVM